jgi:hypothetical protein
MNLGKMLKIAVKVVKAAPVIVAAVKPILRKKKREVDQADSAGA